HSQRRRLSYGRSATIRRAWSSSWSMPLPVLVCQSVLQPALASVLRRLSELLVRSVTNSRLVLEKGRRLCFLPFFSLGTFRTGYRSYLLQFAFPRNAFCHLENLNLCACPAIAA